MACRKENGGKFLLKMRFREPNNSKEENMESRNHLKKDLKNYLRNESIRNYLKINKTRMKKVEEWHVAQRWLIKIV